MIRLITGKAGVMLLSSADEKPQPMCDTDASPIRSY